MIPRTSPLPPTLLVVSIACAGCRSETAATPRESPAPTSYGPSQSEVAIASGPYTLRGDLLIPRGDGPFPAVVYNHGSERDPSLRWLGDTARWFQEQGFVTLLPYRRGSGGSEGPYWRDDVEGRPVDEREAATVASLETQSEDVMSAVRWLALRPEVDPTRIVVSGCSFGGIMSLLAAERGDHLAAAVDFAGASMSWAENGLLRDRLRRAARDTKIPVFLVQAENDYNTTPSVALSAEMDAAGKPHAMRIFPPHGKTHAEGHGHFCTRGQAEWGPDVLAFLRQWSIVP